MKSKIFDNLGLKILALVSAIVIWILVVSINDPVANKTFRDVKVNVINEEVVTSEGKTYQIENGATANVTVRAQRSVLSRLKADRIVATADMKDMTLSSMIPVEVSITGYEGRYQRATANPVNIQVSIEDIITNKYPITVSTSGSLRDGYALAGTEVDPETVTISGPESVINSIDHAAAKISLDASQRRRFLDVGREDFGNHSVHGEDLRKDVSAYVRPGRVAEEADECKMAAAKANDLLGGGKRRLALVVIDRGDAVRRIVRRPVEKYDWRLAERFWGGRLADAGTVRDASVRLPDV